MHEDREGLILICVLTNTPIWVFRVSLMSLPQNKDIYLLDDPLAAVDANVAEHLMNKCIIQLLGGKTRILCTHRIEFVDKADMVVLMDNGTIIKTGHMILFRCHIVTSSPINVYRLCSAVFKNELAWWLIGVSALLHIFIGSNILDSQPFCN